MIKRISGESLVEFSRRQELDQCLREYNLTSLPNDDYDSFLYGLADTVNTKIDRAIDAALDEHVCGGNDE